VDPGAWGPIAVTEYFFEGADGVRVAVNRTGGSKVVNVDGST